MQMIVSISFVIFGLVSFIIFWLHADSLAIRFEVKTFLKALGFGILGTAATLNFLNPFLGFDFSQISIWLISISFYLIFLALILDPHSKLQLGFILAIIALFFLGNHALLALQGVLITTTVFQLAYTTKHRDLIPFGLGFSFVAIGEFFYFCENFACFEGISAAGSFMYIFASISLFAWVWQYLIIRFNLKRKMLKF